MTSSLRAKQASLDTNPLPGPRLPRDTAKASQIPAASTKRLFVFMRIASGRIIADADVMRWHGFGVRPPPHEGRSRSRRRLVNRDNRRRRRRRRRGDGVDEEKVEALLCHKFGRGGEGLASLQGLPLPLDNMLVLLREEFGRESLKLKKRHAHGKSQRLRGKKLSWKGSEARKKTRDEGLPRDSDTLSLGRGPSRAIRGDARKKRTKMKEQEGGGRGRRYQSSILGRPSLPSWPS